MQEWIARTVELITIYHQENKYEGLVRSPSVTLLAPQVIIFPDCDYTSPLIKAIKYSRRNIYQRDNMTCQYCGRQADKGILNLDHVIPRSRGGPSSWSNVVTSCKPCNDKMGYKLLM
jgi:hypothetical protein